jgi:N-acetylmuramoyl-L-alanine amidase
MSPSTLRSALLTGALTTSLLAPLGGFALAAPPEPDPSASPSAAPTPTTVPFATSLSLTRSAGTVRYGGVLTLTGALIRSDGSPVVDAAVQVLARTAGQSSNVVLATVRTGSDGRLARQVSPRTTAEYQLRYGGDALSAPAVSNKTVTNVQPRINGVLTPSVVKLGQTSVLRGAIAPAYSGTKLAVRRRLTDGSWQDAAVVGIDGSGRYSWAVKPGVVGRYVFQVVLPARPAHLQATTAPTAVQVDARNLRQGDRGGDVLTLEKLLAAQKADVGAVDGVYDYDLAHAVLAFQKSQGLPRTSVYDAATRTRLGAPVPVRLRHPAAGRAVEIDLRKQVLYLSEGGVLRRMIDISSGTNTLYESDGVTYRAFTPQGSFRITRKINGIRVSRLGELYRPAYFYQGWAIHGSKSVPNHPASHGCIRVTNPNQDRLFALLTVGTPVTIYTS